MMLGFDLTYAQLLAAFPPRFICDEAQYDATQNIIDQLVDRGELSNAEQDYLSLLGMLIMRFEEENRVIEDMRGVALVKMLLVEEGLRQKDLVPIFKTESIVSAVLNQHRKMTVDHLIGLSKLFDLPIELFIEPEWTQEADTELAEDVGYHLMECANRLEPVLT